MKSFRFKIAFVRLSNFRRLFDTKRWEGEKKTRNYLVEVLLDFVYGAESCIQQFKVFIV